MSLLDNRRKRLHLPQAGTFQQDTQHIVNTLAQQRSSSPQDERKSIDTGLKVSLDLPILRDGDHEVEAHIEEVESQFQQANNGKGVKDSEKINLLMKQVQRRAKMAKKREAVGSKSCGGFATTSF